MAKTKDAPPIPIIDLFAGPGGLGEGFSQYREEGKRRFKIKLSIEKDFHAHQTLTLRAFYRQFPEGEIPDAYYEYLRGTLAREKLFEQFPTQAAAAQDEARRLTLGEDQGILKLIGEKLGGTKRWVLIGGPPCQAYSLVGRSRMLGIGTKRDDEDDAEFKRRREEKAREFAGDHRHLLYREYLKVIAEYSPSVFVMENVKGILSAKLQDDLIFPKIIADLKNPTKALHGAGEADQYSIYSLVKEAEKEIQLSPLDYLIRAEDYGVPQTRHRVILIGVRRDLDLGCIPVLQPSKGGTVRQIIGDLPPLTPGLSKDKDAGLYESLASIKNSPLWGALRRSQGKLHAVMKRELKGARRRETRGADYVKAPHRKEDDWYTDPKLLGFCNHETRSHIKADLWRYFFCACFAKIPPKKSPHLVDFPKELLPLHKNVDEAVEGKKFGDRFRVQIAGKASTTITSHISKDGHYFIHYDPKQYRSLTVREAARLQTFPDNYYFEGPRTQQFHQVGNAVPPRLAIQVALLVSDLIPNDDRSS